MALKGTALKLPEDKASATDAWIAQQVTALPSAVIGELQELNPPVYPKGSEILAEFYELFGLESDASHVGHTALSDDAVHALLDMDLANYPRHVVALMALLAAFGVPDEKIAGSKVGNRLDDITKNIMPGGNSAIENVI